jgi:hypothetical protein
MRRKLGTFVAAGVVAGMLAASSAAAQIIDVHATASVETIRESTSWGGGLGLGTVYLPSGVALLGMTVGADYVREQHLGKGLGTVSLDATLSPPNMTARFLPYLGGSVGLNWSGGELSQWSGTRVGLDVTLGVKALLGGAERVGWKLEQRYGYVRGFEHAFATRLGLLIAL